MIRIIDGFFEWQNCFPDGHFSLPAWQNYLDALCPSVRTKVEQDAAGYDFETEILPVLERLPQAKQELNQLYQSFLECTNHLEERIQQAVAAHVDAEVLLYVGLCNGAGWAVRVNNRPMVLLGMEKILELHWTDVQSMHGLIDHELGHLWHSQMRTACSATKTPREKALWQLYSEGVAMYFEQQLCGDEWYFHQDRNGWLSWCRRHEKRLFREYLRRVREGEPVQPFFGDWCSFEGHSDTGYYLGARLIRKALQSVSQQEMLNSDLAGIEAFLLQCADAQDGQTM